MTMPTILDPRHPGDTIALKFIAEGWQSGADIAYLLAEFISHARSRLDIAIYDCRLDEDAAEPIRTAPHDRIEAGVQVRLVYDRSLRKPQTFDQFDQVGGDFAEVDTHERVEELGLPEDAIRAINGDG